MKISTFLISCVLTVLVFQISAQNRIYVSPNGNGLANGSSWNNALPGNQIQSAIDGLTSGGEVWIAAGTYLPTQTYDNSADVRRRAFTLRANVHVFGGFAGNETDTAQRTDFGEGGANETILSGDIGIPGDSTDNSYHVIWALAAADNTRLDGLTIRDGVANGNIINDRSGGGMHLSGKTILFKCVIKNNYAETNGGGGFVRSNNELHYCTIKENHADGLAGGIYFIHFNLSSNVEPIANHCLFFKNSTPSEGGGAHLRGGGQIYNSRFIGNLAQRGGAAYIHNQGAIVNCIAANNRATITGGGFHITAGNIINSTIVRNQSGGTNGGGVYRSGSTGLVQNCVIWGNNNQFRYLGSNVAVENTAMQSGFSVPAGGQGPGIITLSNQNSGNDPGTLYPHFVNPSAVIGNNPTNPEILLDFDWNITCESALIDMGATSHIPSHITTDFLSNNRFTDGNGNGDTLPDLGAFEHSKQLQTTVTICPGDTVLLGNQIINAPGVYSDTLSGIGSCDSILQLTVIALPTDSGFVNAQICEGDVFTYRGQAFSTPGKHYLTAPSSGDCDSIIEINLSVAPIDTVTLADTTVFEGQGAVFFQTPVDSSGLYIHITPSSQGCDSVIQQNITFLEVDSIVNAAFCSGTSFSFQGNTLTAPGDYFFIQTDSSVIHLMLIEQGGDTTDLGNVFFSMGTTYNFFGTNLNAPGTYFHTLTASTGCDSVVKINLYYRKYVTETGSGSQNGNSWATAHSASQLQTAIDNIATNGGGQVWVAKGIYKRGTLRHQNFFLRTGVELIGGFVGNETDTAQRVSYKLNEINQTVLSADIGVVGDSTDNAYNVIIQNTPGYALIDGFVIRDAQGIGFSAEGAGVVMRPGGVLRNSVIYKNYGAFKGGGLFADQATVEYCSFIENRANSYGGAALIRSSTVRHCYFENNSSSNGGGALQIEFDHTLIDSCTFESNHLNTYGWGGAISFDGTVDTAVVQYSTFNNNTAVLGGAVHNFHTATEILYQYCVFTNNHAPDFTGPNSTQQGTGGAMRIVNNRAVHCTFSNNSATRGGAVWVGLNGVVDSCTFNNNTASARGGAIYGWDNGHIRNSVINGGSSPNGGGAFLEGTSVLEHSIIQNAQSPLGGGVYVESDAVVRHSILRYNNSNAGGGVLIQNGGMVLDCDIYGNSASNGGGASTRSNGGPIINSRIYNNSSNSNGGGIYLNLSNTQGGEVINCNVYNNHAGLDGGGIHFNFGGRAINTNISRNSANRNGGGVFLNFRGNVRNGIIWGNSSQVASSSSGTALSIDTTAIQGGYSGNAAGNLITALDTNNNGQAPLNYIRFTQPTSFVGQPTNATDSTELQQADWSLLCGSAAIDAGNNLSVPDTITTDKVGNNRFLATGTGQPIVDLGPIEANFTYYNSQTLCVGDSFMLGQQIITEPGTYSLNTTSSLGCDSTLIVDVAFLPTDTFHIQVTACQNSGYVFDKDTLFTPGVYYASFASPNFCDSIVELDLSVVSSYASQSQAAICLGNTFVFRGQILTQTGVYRDTLMAINGCDSIISLQLDVQVPDTTQLFLSGCGSLTFDGITYTTPGTYLLQYPSVTACDSFVELNVSIVQNFHDTLVVSACGFYEYNNQVYSASGFYSHSFISSQNCDSTVVLDLSIWQSDSSNLSVSACESYDFNGQVLTQSGIYFDTLSTIHGCDSIVTLQLSILQATSASTTVTACANYNFNGQLLTQSGTYTDTLMAANGCDSIVQLSLTILQPVNSNLTVSSCEDFNFNGILLTQSGTYTDTLTAANGCDSIVNLSLTIEQPTVSNITVNACGDYNFNGILLTQSGTYTDTLTGTNGCDSIVNLQLSIQTIDLGVTNNDPTLIAQAVGVDYQWYDCMGDSILRNQTAQSFTATHNGTYAVILTDGSCTDTSDCYVVSTIGVWVGNLDHLQLYPNPTRGQITLQGDALIGATIRLMDIRGSVLHLSVQQDHREWQYDLSHFAAGTYMLEVIRSNARKVFMVVVN